MYKRQAGSPALAERLDRVLPDALDADPESRPSARDLAARAPEIGRPGTIELPDGARLAAGALRAATARPTRNVASRRGRGRGVRHPVRPWGPEGHPAGRRRRAGRLGLVLLVIVLAVGAGALVRGRLPGWTRGADAVPVTAALPSSEDPARTEAAEVPGATTGPETEATPTREAADAEATSDMMPVVVELSLARDTALNEGDAVALALSLIHI